MTRLHLRSLACGLLLVSGAAAANDFPTVERVLYVQDCMRAHPGPQFEMINKCSCALDTLAAKVKFEDYTIMNTSFKANSIGGERGSYVRDVDVLQKEIRRFRQLQSDAKKSCFINSDPR
jgi:hypothetical protein